MLFFIHSKKHLFFHRTQWIYDGSDVIYPSVYMSEQIHPKDRVRMVRGRMKESIRLARQSPNAKKPQVIAYFRYVFTDTKKFLSDVSLTIKIIFKFLLNSTVKCSFYPYKNVAISFFNRKIRLMHSMPSKALVVMVSYCGAVHLI